MTISSTTARAEYTGNGVTTSFSFPYYVIAAADLKVYKEGVLQTITTHYTLSGSAPYTSGTNVQFVSAPASGDDVVIIRDPEITQAVDLVENDPLPVEAAVERPLDKLTMIAQRFKDRLDRGVLLPDSYVGDASPLLPEPVALAHLRWNAAADALETAVGDESTDSFTASGTGAVSRLVTAKLADIVSAADYGASPSASAAANTTAINNALATGKSVVIPAGEYDFNGKIKFTTDGQWLRGEGRGVTQLNWTGSTGSTLIGAVSTSLIIDVKASDFRVDFDCDSCIALDYSNFSYSNFRDLTFGIYGNNTRGTYGKGRASGDGPYYNMFDNVHVLSNNIAGVTSGSVCHYGDRVNTSGVNYNGPNANRFRGGRCAGADYNVRFLDGNGNVFDAITSESIEVAHYEFGTATHDDSGTASAGGQDTITDATKSWTVNQWLGGCVKITGGTGSGQLRPVLSNTGTAITVEWPWGVRPDNTSTYQVFAAHGGNNTVRDPYIEGASGAHGVHIHPGVNGVIVDGGSYESLVAGKFVKQYVQRRLDRLTPAYSEPAVPITFGLVNVAASLTDQALTFIGGQRTGLVPLHKWAVVGMDVNFNGVITAGTLDISIVENGSPMGGAYAVRCDANNLVNYGGGSYRPELFPWDAYEAANISRSLGVTITTSGSFLPDGSPDLYVTLWVQMR